MRRLIMFLLYVSAISMLAPVVLCAAQPIFKVTEYVLPSIDGRPYRPRISGDWVIGVKNSENAAETVFLINVPNKQLSTIFKIADGTSIFPHVAGNLAVWTGVADQIPSLRGKLGDRGTLKASMIIYDINKSTYYAPKLNTISAFFCSIHGKYVAYELGSRIYIYDVTNGKQRRISDDNPYHHTPEMYGDIVVWSGTMAGSDKRQVYMYRISTDQQTQITDGAAIDYRGPQTDGRYITWWTDSGVDVYDTTTGKTVSIPKGFFPAVDKGILVYQRTEKGVSPVYGMDLATNQEFRISSGSATVGPDIDGNRVIWCSGNAIYCADLVRNTDRKFQ